MKELILKIVGTAFLELAAELLLPGSGTSGTAKKAVGLICTAVIAEQVIVMLETGIML